MRQSSKDGTVLMSFHVLALKEERDVPGPGYITVSTGSQSAALRGEERVRLLLE